MPKINLQTVLDGIDEYWSQRTVAKANGQLFKLAKGLGATHWHRHDDQDELFIVLKGSLRIRLESAECSVHAGELFVVEKGQLHSPVADAPCEFMVVGLNITSNRAGGKPN